MPTNPNAARTVRVQPVKYESKGRQHLVVVSQPGGGRGGRGAAPAPQLPEGTPRGFIAFALPKK